MRAASRSVFKESELSASPLFAERTKGQRTSYDVETFCSLSTVFRTVGRFIMRSCHAV